MVVATKAPPDERGGNRHARPTATAPHPDSTLPGHSAFALGMALPARIGNIGAAQRKCGRDLIRVQRFELRPCLTANRVPTPPGTFDRVRQTVWVRSAVG